jgi:hypothetical protein
LSKGIATENTEEYNKNRLRRGVTTEGTEVFTANIQIVGSILLLSKKFIEPEQEKRHINNASLISSEEFNF